jgi:hypothetical protein
MFTLNPHHRGYPLRITRKTKQRSTPTSAALAALAAANHAEVRRRAEAEKQGSIAATAAEQRADRQKASPGHTGARHRSIARGDHWGSPAVKVTPSRGGGWSIQLGTANLARSTP